MKIAVLGTGVVGQSLGGRLADLGHQVSFGTRSPADTLARSEPDQFGNPPFGAWLASRPEITLADFAGATADVELIINATNGHGSIPALHAAGDHLDGKVIVDVTNALDFAGGFPPSLFVVNTDSLAEQLQREFPTTRVVKTLNTMNAYLMIDPTKLADGEHTVFVSGDDPAAKETVSELLRGFGWRDILDLGDLSTARGAEMYVALWVRLLGPTGGNGQFNIKVVR